MVKVDVLPLLDGDIGTVLVVRILRNNDYFALRKTFNKLSDYRCFSRAGTTRNSDDKHKDITIND